MSTVIEGSAVCRAGWRSGRSARRLADMAGREALAGCGQDPADVDLLINAGLYHDRNLGEPALAPLIQEDIGANSEDPFPGGAGTFSFDVANGSSGVLTSLQIVDGFLRAGTVGTALIVASDADPGHGLAPDFPFQPAGGALVCHWNEGASGLGRILWHNHPDDGRHFRATVGLRNRRNVLDVERSDSYPEALADAAARAVTSVLTAEEVEPGSVGVVLVAPGLPGFPSGLAERCSLAENRILTCDPRLHTVAGVAVLDAARRDGRLGGGNVTLIVEAGAGITAGAALYRA